MDDGSPHCSKHHGVPPGRGGGCRRAIFDISRCMQFQVRSTALAGVFPDGAGFGGAVG